jgi:hypothetical protein
MRTKRRKIADAFREEGMKVASLQTRRDILLRQLRMRFRNVPPKIAAAIAATDDIAQLDSWLNRILTARTLEEMDIALP